MRKAKHEDERVTDDYVAKGRLLQKVKLDDMQLLFDDTVQKWGRDPRDLKSMSLVSDIYDEAWLRGRVPDEEKHAADLEKIKQHGFDLFPALRARIERAVGR